MNDIHQKLDEILRNQHAMAEVQQQHNEVLRAVVSGITSLTQTLDAQTEMLGKLLEAAGAESPQGNELSDTLRKILEAIELGNDIQLRLESALTRLPGEVEDAAARGVQLGTGGGVDLPD